MQALAGQCAEAASRLADFADLLLEDEPIGQGESMVEALQRIKDYAEGILGDSAKAEDALRELSEEAKE